MDQNDRSSNVPDRTDRSRLKEMHQSDLTEGRINEDFLEWLKSKGMSYLLVALVALCVYFGIVRWRHHQVNYQAEAWTELSKARLPSSFEDVAQKYADVGSVAELARLRAANQLLSAVQTGKEIGADATVPTKDLTADDRANYLARADRLYTEVLASDDQSLEQTLLAVSALTGRATVAESLGEFGKAKEHLESAAKRAEPHYPVLAQDARTRAERIDPEAKPAVLPTQTELLALQQKRTTTPPPLEPAMMEPWVRDLVLPKQ